MESLTDSSDILPGLALCVGFCGNANGIRASFLAEPSVHAIGVFLQEAGPTRE